MIDQIMEFLTKPVIMGIPMWAVILGVIAFLYFTNKSKPEKFKRINTKKELNRKFSKAFKDYGTSVKKKLYFGMFQKGFILRSNSMYWDSNLKFLIHKSKFELAKFLKKNPSYRDDKGKLKKDFKKINAFQVCGKGILNRGLAWLGFGIKTYLIPDQYLLDTKDDIVVNPAVSPTSFFDFYIIGEAGKEIVENACFKLNRENELDEFVNQIPKQNYLEVSTSSAIAKAREKAHIEKQKYAGQLESAEGG